jgi:hypothetical protein
VNAVRESQAFDHVATVESDDEIGELVEGFNAMLGEIRDRDAASSSIWKGWSSRWPTAPPS